MSDEGTRPTVLVVDDTPDNLVLLSEILKGDYGVRVALNGEKALAIACSPRPPDIILLDVMMPGMDGHEVCRRLKASPATRPIPVIFVTALGAASDESAGFALGAVDYITKPLTPAIVRARVATHLALYHQERHLEALVSRRTEELHCTRLQIIRTLGRAAEHKDEDTGLHVVRMSKYSEIIARAAGLRDSEADMILNASPMHDVGKIGVADAILQKPGKLDAREWEAMKQHPVIGAEIIGSHATGSDLLEMARIIALTHHEKWNGKGYPAGLAGEDIPLAGRIVAIADVFDALTSVRPYKKAWEVEDAFGLIRREAGAHFDPRLVEAFFASREPILDVRRRYAEPAVAPSGAGVLPSL